MHAPRHPLRLVTLFARWTLAGCGGTRYGDGPGRCRPREGRRRGTRPVLAVFPLTRNEGLRAEKRAQASRAARSWGATCPEVHPQGRPCPGRPTARAAQAPGRVKTGRKHGLGSCGARRTGWALGARPHDLSVVEDRRTGPDGALSIVRSTRRGRDRCRSGKPPVWSLIRPRRIGHLVSLRRWRSEPDKSLQAIASFILFLSRDTLDKQQHKSAAA